MKIAASNLRSADAYRLLTSLLVPRPIAWVGTRSRQGVDNLAPFSYFMGVGSRPPSLAISVARKRVPGGFDLKDTARNILETEAFTVSMVSRASGPAMAVTAGAWAPGVSEFEESGLQAVDGDVVAAPRPALARVAMECRLWQALDLESTHLFVGEVLLWHLDDAVLVPGSADAPVVDPRALDPLGRLGGTEYAVLGEILTLVPPTVEPG